MFQFFKNPVLCLLILMITLLTWATPSLAIYGKRGMRIGGTMLFGARLGGTQFEFSVVQMDDGNEALPIAFYAADGSPMSATSWQNSNNATTGNRLPVWNPMSSTRIEIYTAVTGTSYGTWLSSEVGADVYTKGLFQIWSSDLEGDCSGTVYIHSWSHGTVLTTAYFLGVQEGDLIISNGEAGVNAGNSIVMDPMPLHYMVEIRASTASVYCVAVLSK